MSGSARTALYGWIAFAGFFPLLFGGCGSQLPMVGSQKLTIELKGLSDLNSGGHAVVVRIYQLAGEVNFSSATKEAFLADDETALGPELIEKTVVTLLPGESKRFVIEAKEEVAFIGAAADFFRPSQEDWRGIIRLEQTSEEWLGGRNDVVIEVGKDRLRLSRRDKLLASMANKARKAAATRPDMPDTPGAEGALDLAGGGKAAIDLVFVGGQNLNQGGNAVQIRVYQLPEERRFSDLTFEQLWDDDEQSLGADLLERRDLMLGPDEVQRLRIEIADDTNFIGMVAHFFERERSGWRLVHPVPRAKEEALSLLSFFMPEKGVATGVDPVANRETVWIEVGADRLEIAKIKVEPR